MSRPVVRFWLSSVVVVLVYAVVAAWLFPYEALRLETGADRHRVWLLCLWTGGVLGICFGLAALIGFGAPLGVREVVEAGSVTKAAEARRQARRQEGGFHSNFAWWLVVTGGLLVATYFMALAVSR